MPEVTPLEYVTHDLRILETIQLQGGVDAFPPSQTPASVSSSTLEESIDLAYSTNCRKASSWSSAEVVAPFSAVGEEGSAMDIVRVIAIFARGRC